MAENRYKKEILLEDERNRSLATYELLTNLADAARTRKVVPTGDLAGIADLLTAEDADTQEAAVSLVGLWRVESAGNALRQLVLLQ